MDREITVQYKFIFAMFPSLTESSRIYFSVIFPDNNGRFNRKMIAEIERKDASGTEIAMCNVSAKYCFFIKRPNQKNLPGEYY